MPQVSHLRRQARKKRFQHHLRHAAEQPLADAGDGAACVDAGLHVDDRRLAVGAQRDVGRPLDEPRVPCPSPVSRYDVRVTLSERVTTPS